MLDTFAIGLPTGEWAYDEHLQAEVEVIDPLFTTKGRVKVTALVARESEVGGRTAVTVTRELHIPTTSPAVPAGAVAVCAAVDPTSDPTLLGARLTLSGPAPGSQTTARRLSVVEEVA